MAWCQLQDNAINSCAASRAEGRARLRCARPARGARVRILGRSPPNVSGRLIRSRSISGTRCTISSAAVWACAFMWVRSLIGAHGTPAPCRRATHSSLRLLAHDRRHRLDQALLVGVPVGIGLVAGILRPLGTANLGREFGPQPVVGGGHDHLPVGCSRWPGTAPPQGCRWDAARAAGRRPGSARSAR